MHLANTVIDHRSLHSDRESLLHIPASLGKFSKPPQSHGTARMDIGESL